MMPRKRRTGPRARSCRRLLERKTGFEPATFSLARRCSTTEPLPLVCASALVRFSYGAEGQTRTVDTGIFSAVLYHLSYLGQQLYIKATFLACQGGPSFC